jgi:hypothetical protein
MSPLYLELTEIYLRWVGVNDVSVIPAKAGTSGQEVSAGLPEIPAFAGITASRLAHLTPRG